MNLFQSVINFCDSPFTGYNGAKFRDIEDSLLIDHIVRHCISVDN